MPFKPPSGGGGGGGSNPGGTGSALQYRIDGTTFGGLTNVYSDNGDDLFLSSAGVIYQRNTADDGDYVVLQQTNIAPGFDLLSIGNGTFGVIPGNGVAVLTAQAGSNSLLNIDRQDAAEGQILGEISFTALDDLGMNVGYGGLRTTIIDNDNTSLDGQTDFFTMSNGFEVTPLSLANGQVRLSRIPRFDAESVTGGVAYVEFETGLDTNTFTWQFGAGTTVPGAVAGWNGSAIFTDADATTVNRPYINVGTSSSADFRRIATFTSGSTFEVLGNGTAAAPSLTFAGDNDTGFYILGANTLGSSTGGGVRTITNSSGFYTVTGGSTTVAALGMNNSQGTGLSSDGANMRFLLSNVERFTATADGQFNILVGGAGATSLVGMGRNTSNGVFLNAPSGANVELRTNNVTRLAVQSATNILASLSLVFQSATAPAAGSGGFGRDAAGMQYNTLTGTAHNFSVNGTTTVIFGANTIGFNGAAAVAQSTAIPNATGGATVDSEARTAINTLLAYLRTRGDIAT